MTNFLLFAITFRKSHQKPERTLEPVCEDGVSFFGGSELIFTSLYAGSSIQHASEQHVRCIHLCCVNFALFPTKLILEIQTALSR